jgi:transposase
MSSFTQFCGIDVSKDTLDFCLMANKVEEKGLFEKIANQSEQIAQQCKDAKYDNTLFILEYTGTYSAKLLHELTQINRPIRVVNPYQSKCFMASQGLTNKNDKNAAYCLALMGKQVGKLRPYKAPSEEMQKRKQVMSAVEALEKQQQQLKNQLHALEQLPIIESKVKLALQTVLESVEEQLKPLQKQLYDPAKDEAFEVKKSYAMSVIGIGHKTAQALLLASNGMEGFDNCDKLSKSFGVTPDSHRSGTSVNKKGHITKFGSSEVRKLLYMCTRSAIRYNQPCKELYERLRRKGKSHKIAAVAVMHKLVKQVFACVTAKTLFDNEYHLKNKKKN